ncbi:MAG: hypothetical protein F4X35_06805 [Alphaproteobacteria bacterium]|nr:hypothetical protein [Alphaproteobacteria bacterium]
MKLVKQHCIYCTAEKWEKIRRRAKAAKKSMSRFGIECCRRALGNEAEPSAASGHPLVLTGTEQVRLAAAAEVLLAAERIAVREPGGGEAEVLLREAVRFRRLFEREQAE